MASSAGSRSLARARGDGIRICGSNPSPDAGFSRGELAAARPSSGADTGNREKKNRARAYVSGCIALSSIRIDVTRRRARAATRDVAGGKCGSARPGSRSGASLLRAALEQGTAAGAEVATVMGHARPDAIDIRDVLLAEPHRIRFAGRALLRRPLLRGGRPRREREREAHERGRERGRERGGGHDRPELRLCDTYFHYRPSSWCSVPVSTVNPTSMASSAAGDGDPARIVKANLNGSVVRSIW